MHFSSHPFLPPPPFSLCSPLATMMQWNINDRTHIHSLPKAFFFFSVVSPTGFASFPLFRNQINIHIAAKAAKWKKEQAQSMRLWMFDCFPCVFRNVARLAHKYCLGLVHKCESDPTWRELFFVFFSSNDAVNSSLFSSATEVDLSDVWIEIKIKCKFNILYFPQ